MSFSTRRRMFSVCQLSTAVPKESFTVRSASVAASSSQLQSTVVGMRIVRTSFASIVEVQFAVSKATIPLASLSVLQESPCCHLNVGFSPRELFSDTVTSVTKLTSSPCATFTIKFRAMPSGAAIPPSNVAPMACVFILYAMSMLVIFTRPDVCASTASGTSTTPSPLSGMYSLNASTKVGWKSTSTPTTESSLTSIADSFRNRMLSQSKLPSAPTSIRGRSGYPSS